MKASESLRFSGQAVVQRIEDRRVFGQGEIVGAAFVNMLAGTTFSAVKDGETISFFWDGKKLSQKVF